MRFCGTGVGCISCLRYLGKERDNAIMGQVISQMVGMRIYVAGNEVKIGVGLNKNQVMQQKHDAPGPRLTTMRGN